jgi:hypothetical protein
MPASDWRQRARERPIWIGNVVEEAIWAFVDQKWKDVLNVAAAEPAGLGLGGGGVRPLGADKKGQAEAKKLSMAAIHVARISSPSQAERLRDAHLLMCSGVLDNMLCGDVGHSEY